MNVRTCTFVFFVISDWIYFTLSFCYASTKNILPHPANGRFLEVNSCGLAAQSQLNDHSTIIRQFLLNV